MKISRAMAAIAFLRGTQRWFSLCAAKARGARRDRAGASREPA